jgi:hypothetical protein
MFLEEKVFCPICSGGSTLMALVPNINLKIEDRVELRSCNVCNHWWHNPIPSQDDLLELYRISSPFVVSADGSESYRQKSQSTTFDSFHRYVLKDIFSSSPCNYLEIGAGGGQLLRKFQHLGYRCYGVDPAGWVECDEIVSDLRRIPKDIKFHIFILQDVLEHLNDPLEMMIYLRTMAEENATAYCSFPCNDSHPAKTMRERWGMIRPYGHLHYFSRESATRMLSIGGWKIMDQRLAYIAPLSRMLYRWDFRGVLYSLIKGGKDQLYVKAGV